MSIKDTCPGSTEIRSPYPEPIVCPFCNLEGEIWTDEPDTGCKGCGKTLSRDMKTTCLEWCPAAKECVGLEKYERLMKAVKKDETG